MRDELSNLNEKDQLKAENDFLKMKIMLEHGGCFSAGQNNTMELPPEIENQFLNNILAFEKQFEQRRTIRVFDKIGRPQHFKPVAGIAEADIDKSWEELSNYLNEHGISVDVCSPNITTRELYRFTTEELFEQETDDMDLPGWTTGFIYDEFHPDPVYDNSRMIEQDLFYEIFRKTELFSEFQYANDGFVFNGRDYDCFKIFSDKISSFKKLFDEVEMREFDVSNCSVKETTCCTEGKYKAVAKMGANEIIFAGDFTVKLLVGELGYWHMKEIQINGFNP